MLSAHQYSNFSPRLLVQSEPGFFNDRTLTQDAKEVMAILDLLSSGEDISASDLMGEIGCTPDALIETLIELCDRGYLLKDRADDDLDDLS